MKSEKIPNHKVTYLSTSPVKCRPLYLEKLKKSFLSNKSSWAFEAATGQVLRAWNYVYLFYWWELVYCGWPKNSGHPVATRQHDISSSHVQRMHPTLSKSVTSLLRYRNLVIPTSFSLNLALKSRGSIIEKCCWRRNSSSDHHHCWRCDCLPSRQCTNTSCSWHGWASVPWDIPFINHDM